MVGKPEEDTLLENKCIKLHKLSGGTQPSPSHEVGHTAEGPTTESFAKEAISM